MGRLRTLQGAYFVLRANQKWAPYPDNDPAAAREKMAKAFEIYGMLPSYRAMLDREGAVSPGDVGIVGDEAALREQLGRGALERLTAARQRLAGRSVQPTGERLELFRYLGGQIHGIEDVAAPVYTSVGKDFPFPPHLIHSFSCCRS